MKQLKQDLKAAKARLAELETIPLKQIRCESCFPTENAFARRHNDWLRLNISDAKLEVASLEIDIAYEKTS